MGICGTAMGNAALLARAAGHEVSGVDTGVYPPMSMMFAEAEITLREGYDAAWLTKLAPDVVAVGNGFTRELTTPQMVLRARMIRTAGRGSIPSSTPSCGRDTPEHARAGPRSRPQQKHDSMGVAG